jgi:DNA-binding XRE family transcriptional regulator
MSHMRALTASSESELRRLGASVALARGRRRLSARALAARMGVDRRTLAQLERGNPAVSLGILVQAVPQNLPIYPNWTNGV